MMETTNQSTEMKDITIIGGGSAGLYAAFYAGMRDLSVQIIELRDRLGGKINFYPQKLIWDVGGITPIGGGELIDQLVEQGKTFDPTVYLNEQIVKLEKIDDLFVATGSSGETFLSRKVILATGTGIAQPKKLPLEDAIKFERTNVHYQIKELEYFKGKRVLMIGGGNSSIDWANEIEPLAKEMTLIHRNDQFKAHEAQLSKLEKSSTTIKTHTEIKKLIPDHTQTKVAAVTLFHNQTGIEEQISVDEVIVNIGIDRQANFFHDNEKLDLELVDNGYLIKGDSKGITNIEGLYACGDTMDFDGKLRLIAGAFNDAGNAVNHIKLNLDPDAKPKAKVSSHNKRFDEKNQKLRAHLYGDKL
ncbi:NAD(P)/FAD-dependent oxidoreductase [Marinilactibacillus sp. XAAS-LB27]|uniref:NAD(P)/FAD-dependent oxidoreductase n=1 Tax=Marinilactibacillus sp. XAAS-LB27 TaxID=3114538 RepID=UPI002E17740B|nr:NAD(P)/FAD-dependent oxidoreductase [Marinilactibacillus sp. XAAS-LB27]